MNRLVIDHERQRDALLRACKEAQQWAKDMWRDAEEFPEFIWIVTDAIALCEKGGAA